MSDVPLGLGLSDGLSVCTLWTKNVGEFNADVDGETSTRDSVTFTLDVAETEMVSSRLEDPLEWEME